MTVYHITPVPKPRMTRRDKWLNPPRPCVAKYWAFKDEIGQANIKLKPSGCFIGFVLPMPKSWSNKKHIEMYKKPHKVRPDLSNLLKALEDALFEEDSHIWHYREVYKVWGYEGEIIIEG